MTHCPKLQLVAWLLFMLGHNSSTPSLAFNIPSKPSTTSPTTQKSNLYSTVAYPSYATNTDRISRIKSSPRTKNRWQNINDSNFQSLLNSAQHHAVLVDAYVTKCGPCKLIERSILALMPKYGGVIDFVKWDTDTAKLSGAKSSREFTKLLISHEVSCRKLPMLILFLDGKPVATRSGMGTEVQLERFLKESLPWLGDELEARVGSDSRHDNELHYLFP